jgi:anti-sigma factor RsiW
MSHDTCDAIRDLLPAHVDGALDAATAETVGAHLAECAACRREREQWVSLNRLLDEHLATAEPVPSAEVEAVVQRVRAEKPAWRVAPTPVRFWRAWLPVAALGATALVLVLIGAYAPGLHWASAKGVLLDQAAAVAQESRALPQSAPEGAIALYADAREWPGQAAAGAARGWDDGRVFAQSLVRRVGLAPLATCLLLLLAANLMVARGARLAPRAASGR